MTRLSPLARALCELALVEAYDPAAGRVVAVPLSWALEQVGHTPAPVRCPDCVYSVGGGQKVSCILRYCPVHAPVGHEAFTPQQIAARGRAAADERRARRGHMRIQQALRIRELLAEQRWTHTQIARRVKVAHGTVTRIANEVAAHS